MLAEMEEDVSRLHFATSSRPQCVAPETTVVLRARHIPVPWYEREDTTICMHYSMVKMHRLSYYVIKR